MPPSSCRKLFSFAFYITFSIEIAGVHPLSEKFPVDLAPAKASAEDFSTAFASLDFFADSAFGFSGLVSLESADGVGAVGGVLASGVVVDFVAGGADFSDFGALAADGADFSAFGAFAAGGGVVAAGGGVVAAGGGVVGAGGGVVGAGGGVVAAGGGVVGAGGGVVGAGGGMVAAAGGVAVGGVLGGASAGFGGVFSSFLVSLAAGAAVLVGAGAGIATGLGGVAVGKDLLGSGGALDEHKWAQNLLIRCKLSHFWGCYCGWSRCCPCFKLINFGISTKTRCPFQGVPHCGGMRTELGLGKLLDLPSSRLRWWGHCTC